MQINHHKKSLFFACAFSILAGYSHVTAGDIFSRLVDVQGSSNSLISDFRVLVYSSDQGATFDTLYTHDSKRISDFRVFGSGELKVALQLYSEGKAPGDNVRSLQFFTLDNSGVGKPLYDSIISVPSMDFSPGGEKLAILASYFLESDFGYVTHGLGVLNTESGLMEWLMQSQGTIEEIVSGPMFEEDLQTFRSVQFVGADKLFIVGIHSVYSYNTTLRELRNLGIPGEGGYAKVEVSPDGRYVVWDGQAEWPLDNSVKLYDVESQKEVSGFGMYWSSLELSSRVFGSGGCSITWDRGSDHDLIIQIPSKSFKTSSESLFEVMDPITGETVFSSEDEHIRIAPHIWRGDRTTSLIEYHNKHLSVEDVVSERKK